MESGGRRGEPWCAFAPKTIRFALAVGPTIPVADQRLRGQLGLRQPRIADLDRPESPANRRQVFRICYFLVTKKLRPRAIGRIGEIMRQLARGIPSTFELGRVFPQERETRIGVPKNDHVAGDGPREEASSRTWRGPSSWGSQLPTSNWAGDFPFSSLRGRWNQRRTPTSLYAPARSPTTNARKWRRAATPSGVVRSPAW